MECFITENIRVGQNNTKTIGVTFAEGSEPIDITDWVMFFGVKKRLSDEEFVIDKEITLHTNPTEGETQIRLEVEDTATAGDYRYEFKAFPPGDAETVKLGRLRIYRTIYGATADAS